MTGLPERRRQFQKHRHLFSLLNRCEHADMHVITEHVCVCVASGGPPPIGLLPRIRLPPIAQWAHRASGRSPLGIGPACRSQPYQQLREKFNLRVLEAEDARKLNLKFGLVQ